MKDYILKPSGADRAAYLNYLLDRLTEFRKARGNHGYLNVYIVRAGIAKQLAWPLDDETHFEETCAFIQAKINNTILGRINASKGRASYHSFAAHGKPKSSVGSASDCSARSTELETHASVDGVSQAAEIIQPGVGFKSPAKPECGTAQPETECGPSVSEATNTVRPSFAPDVNFDEAVVPKPSGELVGSPTAYPAASSLESRVTTKSLELGAWRARTLKAARPLLQSLSLRATADALGVPLASMSRLVSTFAHLADDQLTTENCAGDFANRGQSSEFDALLKVPEIVAEMNRLYVATMGASCAQATKERRTGSIALTLKRLGDFPLMPERLAAKLRGGTQPRPLVDHLKRTWTAEMEAKLRGQKHYALASVSGRRDLTEELADGSRVPLKPGRVWVLDDMSSNIPFWFEVPDKTNLPANISAMVTRHGCAVGRQGLYAWDWASSAWLGFDLIGRLRDAYQASDILRFLRKLMQRYGKPDQIRIEQGVWKSRAISGWKTTEEGLIETENEWQLPDMLGDETTKIADGIKALGVEVVYTYTPRGKPIEGAFNYHQRIVPTFLQQGEGINIGRHAGEFEWPAKQMRRAGDGVLHARDLGFIHIDRLADVAWQAMLWEGMHDKARRDGKPLEILTQYLNNFPLAELTERDLAAFMPEKRSRNYKGGTIVVEVAGETHEFINPEVFALLPTGTKLDFAFDPAEPTLGAAIYDQRGFLCWASYLPAGPVISNRVRTEDDAPQLLKRYKLAHRTAARLLDLKTLRTVKIAEARTRSLPTANDADSAAAAPLPETRRAPATQLQTAGGPSALVTKDSYAEMFGG
jgi:hypothetical protein